VLDGSLFTGSARAPGWDSDIVSAGYAAPVCSLAVNGGRLQPTAARRAPRSERPDLITGRAFARMLHAPDAQMVVGRAAPDARTVATLDSPPLLHLVELMLRESDNVIADALARQVAVAKKQPATFAGAATAIRQTLAELGIDPAGDRLIDGSGLSRLNRVTTGLLSQVLAVAASPEHPELRGVLSGLPVAAYSGTLSGRFGGAAAIGAGTVRAKTGTLSGVSSLAGLVSTADGRLLTFAVVADGVRPGGTLAAEAALDRVAATLAGCGCAA
jgi:D-alanyl-D-alanine carboxypeptidase/D-alanyl-D-alanine-endopeptidase (penicillin-binding protein 4)